MHLVKVSVVKLDPPVCVVPGWLTGGDVANHRVERRPIIEDKRVYCTLRLFYGLMISCETDGHESKPSS